MERFDFTKLDLRQFLDGPSPFGETDRSLENAFALGGATMEEIVVGRVGFTGGRVLDLLSGFGRWLPFLARANREVVALERIEVCTNLASNLCSHLKIENVKLITGDIARVEDLDNGSFDFVWMWSGLQYVDRAYAMSQVHRLLRPGGRLFVGAYNATGLMIEHVTKGADQGKTYEGASQWALSALARGPQADGNPNFVDPEDCAALCERFGFRLVAVAPQNHLDLRRPSGRFPDWESAPRTGAYFRTVEFVAERLSSGNVRPIVERGRGFRHKLGRMFTG